LDGTYQLISYPEILRNFPLENKPAKLPLTQMLGTTEILSSTDDEDLAAQDESEIRKPEPAGAHLPQWLHFGEDAD